MPGLRKDGYTESVESSSSSSRPPERGPAPAPRPERPPDAPETHPFYQPFTPRNPLEIGRRDRNPFPNNPFVPPPLFSDDGDGMFVGPNHPIFNPRLGQISPCSWSVGW
jgi:proteasome inhibitor subunit 1 (PI31)